MIKDQTGDLQAFSPEKLLISLYQSLAHRETAVEDATALSRTVIAQLGHHNAGAVIDRHTLIKATGTILDRFDSLAGTHYAAYHRTEA